MLALSPPRPPLSFRVGITGTRDQRTAEAARPALAQILTLVKDEISGLARELDFREPGACSPYPRNNSVQATISFTTLP